MRLTKNPMDEENQYYDVEETSDEGADDVEVDETEDEADTSIEEENTDAEDDSDYSDDESDDDESDDSSDDDGKGDSDEETDTSEDDETEEEEDDGEEPELRKPKRGAPNSEWAAYRKQQKAKKDAANKGQDADDDESDEEDEDDLSPEDAAAIDKRIAKAIEPYQKAEEEREVDGEIAKFLQENPDFKPYAKKVKRFATHPSRAQVPVKSLFYEVAGDKLMSIGAKRAKAANAKANKTKTGGGKSNPDGKGSKSYADMPLEDFGKELNEAKLNRK